MTAALVILALMAPLMVGGAFYVGIVAGARLARGASPAGAVAETVAEVKEAVQVVVGGGQTAVPTEQDEYQAEMERRSKEIEAALVAQGREIG
jgi:hypothetical protein